MPHLKSDKPGQAGTSPAPRRPAKSSGGAAGVPPAHHPHAAAVATKRPKAPSATAARGAAPSPTGRVRPEEWRGSKRNASIQDAIVSKFKVLSARGKTLTQIADRLGISIGRARNLSAEIRLGKK